MGGKWVASLWLVSLWFSLIDSDVRPGLLDIKGAVNG